MELILRLLSSLNLIDIVFLIILFISGLIFITSFSCLLVKLRKSEKELGVMKIRAIKKFIKECEKEYEEKNRKSNK